MSKLSSGLLGTMAGPLSPPVSIRAPRSEQQSAFAGRLAVTLAQALDEERVDVRLGELRSRRPKAIRRPLGRR